MSKISRPFGLLSTFLKAIPYPAQATCNEHVRNFARRIQGGLQQWYIATYLNLADVLPHDTTKLVAIYVAGTIDQSIHR